MILRWVTWIPVVLFVLITATFITSYCIALASDHVNALLPYISDTGTLPPESCIFGQMLNIAGFITCILAYIRYLQIRYLINRFRFTKIVKILNRWGIWMGFLTGLGLTMVGNFQEVNDITMHLVGAHLTFGVGTIYFCIQTAISYKTVPITCNKLLCIFRLILCIYCIIGYLGVYTFAYLSFNVYSDTGSIGIHLKWTSDMPGFGYHIISTLMEWFLALVFITYILTLTPEFKYINIRGPHVEKYSTMHYYWLPVTMISIPITLAITFFVSVILDLLEDYHPFISELGTQNPLRGWFSQLLNIYAILMAVGFYIRFLQAKQLNNQFLQLMFVNKLNIVGLIVGFLMCLGLSILACFQTSKKIVGMIHFAGACLFFSMGFLYFVTQTALSYYMIGYTLNVRTFLVRLTLIVCLAIGAIVLISFKITAAVKEKYPRHFNTTKGDLNRPYIFFKDNQKYVCASAVAEWIVTLVLTLVALTYADEFSEVHISHPQIHFTNQ